MHVGISADLARAHRDELLREAQSRRPAALARAGRRDRSRSRQLLVRPMSADDIPRVQDLFERLSPRSRFFRYSAPVNAVPHAWLRSLESLDDATRQAVGAFHREQLVGAAYYVVTASDPTQADVAVEVADAFQRDGLGTLLIAEISRLARVHGVTSFSATVLRENAAVARLVRRLGWPAAVRSTGAETRLVLTLPAVAGTRV